MSQEADASLRKVLVLYIDRDNDVGRVCNVSTPIIGREENLKVALRFILSSPEDSDANSLFAAIKTYDEVCKSERTACEIATITGSVEGGYKSDMKLLSELKTVLEKFKADGAIVISDGPEDEKAIPIIQSLVPVISVRRIIVQQQRSIEEMYTIISRYLRRLFEDPHLSRFTGLFGLIVTISSIMVALGLSTQLFTVLSLFIGSYLMIKGFHIDEHLSNLFNAAPIKFVTQIMGAIIIGASIYYGAVEALALQQAPSAEGFSVMLGTFVSKSITTIAIGAIVIFGGAMVQNYLDKNPKYLYNLATIVFILSLREILLEVSNLLVSQNYPISNLIMVSVVWASITVVTFTSLVVYYKLIFPKYKRGAER